MCKSIDVQRISFGSLNHLCIIVQNYQILTIFFQKIIIVSKSFKLPKFTDLIMEDLVLNAIRHIRSISKKKPIYKSILSYIQKSTASNIDLPSVESTCTDMVANGQMV